MEKQIIHIDLAELTVHPRAKSLPEWANDDERFLALAEDIRARGIEQPILIDKENSILDGRHRFRVAKRLQILKVPAILCPDDVAVQTIVGSLLQRRHYSKSALAYMAYPLLQSMHEEALRRQTQNLRKGQQIPVAHSVGNGKTVEDLAAQIGISKTLFQYAADVHAIFAKDPEYKELMEPFILSDNPEDNIGLGRVKQGYGGKEATKGKEKKVHEQLELFETSFVTTFHRFVKLEDISAAKPAIKKVVSEVTEEAELDRLLALSNEIKEQATARKKALAKEAGL